MKVYVGGGHYKVYIDKQREFPALTETPLETNLQLDDGSDTGKRFMVRYDQQVAQPSVERIPPGPTFDEIQELRVTLTRSIYEHLQKRRLYVHRFGAASSIDLSVEQNMEGFR